MVLAIVGRGYSGKNRVLEFMAKIFGWVASTPLTYFANNQKSFEMLPI